MTKNGFLNFLRNPLAVLKAADAVTKAASSAGDNSFGSDGGGGQDHALESKGEKEEENEETEGEDGEGEAE